MCFLVGCRVVQPASPMPPTSCTTCGPASQLAQETTTHQVQQVTTQHMGTIDIPPEGSPVTQVQVVIAATLVLQAVVLIQAATVIQVIQAAIHQVIIQATILVQSDEAKSCK